MVVNYKPQEQFSSFKLRISRTCFKFIMLPICMMKLYWLLELQTKWHWQVQQLLGWQEVPVATLLRGVRGPDAES